MNGKRFKILSLHGFLGYPEDFDFLVEDFDLISLNLSEFVNRTYEDIYHFVKEIPNLDLIIGYSFGSRLGARLFSDLKHINPELKFIGLAGHLGIANKDQLIERVKIEETFINHFDELSNNEFLEYWNGLSLFESDERLQRGNFINAKDYFLNYSLSKQPCLDEKLIKFSDSILFIYGEYDQKYCQYAKENLSLFKVKYFDDCGHRVIQKSNLVLKEVREFLCQ